MKVETLIEKANILIEALPYITGFFGKTIVIKYGGAAMLEGHLREKFAQDVVLMKYVGMNPVIVHGGGPQITGMMKRLGKESRFVKGVRVTDPETMEIVEMVLGGRINSEIVSLINRQGGRAVGLSGKDGKLITAHHLSRAGRSEVGMVGEVESVDPRVLLALEENRFIPVISPIAEGRDGQTYNINADLVAGAIAAAVRAEKLIILTDVEGIRDSEGRLVPTLSKKDIPSLIKKGVMREGMLPKGQACLAALEGGVPKAHIIDGRVPHALLLEIFTREGIGTEVVA